MTNASSARTDRAIDRIAVSRQAYLIFAVLCAGFLASQFYRVSNAVIAPELMRGLAISPEEMGVVTGVFFLTFAAMQIPAGILLDRFGPQRTISALFVIAVAGAAVFATADGVVGLAVGRGLIGIGCAAGLMGSLVAIARWFPPDRFAAMSSLIYVLGGAGLLLATTPLAWASDTIGWRGAFWAMAALTALFALLDLFGGPRCTRRTYGTGASTGNGGSDLGWSQDRRKPPDRLHLRHSVRELRHRSCRRWTLGGTLSQ